MEMCDLNGLPTDEAQAKINAWLEANGVGRAAVNCRLRDWIFSRQKYWGEPFPTLHAENGETIVVGDEELLRRPGISLEAGLPPNPV